MSDNTHFENLRRDEEQSQHERAVNDAFAERAGAHDAPQFEEGKEPGHLGNDTSGMTLLETDLANLTRQESEPNDDVRQALKHLKKFDIREAIEDADN
ncbi:hypothetical protein [Tessaracoccus massiliensis]|uniref:hypothetical protein n=1 Tax=Tessaracoccus massiliensis TaxID=1522311 RepID=UPI0005908F2D|nr:hypothetical protein [Tessaracoccus massiliensis]